jgi:ATP-dependent RNA helicase DDX54/DBP10
MELPKPGESELKDVVQPKKYRHNNTYTPNVESKSFQRKLATKEKAWRKEGKKGADLAAAKKDYVGQFTQKAALQKQELKTAAQIAKQRNEKEKRREKTGRHKKKRK